MITPEKRKQLIAEFATSENDTGSPAVQVAVLTERINHLTKHFATHKKDYTSMRGMMIMIGQRRRFLKTLQTKNLAKYEEIVKRLDLRK